MVLDKSRIQGFGSDGAVVTASSSSSSTAAAKVPACPSGHILQPWAATPGGWCDGCGKTICAGEMVMDCRKCNYLLCSSSCPRSKVEAQDGMLWGALSSIKESMSSPAVQSAIDSVTLRFGDVVDAAAQDMSEMATEIKSYISATIGMQESASESDQPKTEQVKKIPVSPRQRSQAMQLISDFAQKYPAARVAPNKAELDALWASCSILQPGPVAGALYEQLSFSDGDYSWQPRLRVLYALEHLFRKGNTGKDVGTAVFHHAHGILEHLTEVPQCAEKAKSVILVLSGQVPVMEVGQAEDSAEAAISASQKARATATPDLLDLATASESAAKQFEGGMMDLLTLGDEVETTPAQVSAAPAALAAPAISPDLGLLGDLLLTTEAPSRPPATADSSLLSLSGPSAATTNNQAFVPSSASSWSPAGPNTGTFSRAPAGGQALDGFTGTGPMGAFSGLGPSAPMGRGAPTSNPFGGYAALGSLSSGPSVVVGRGQPMGGMAQTSRPSLPLSTSGLLNDGFGALPYGAELSPLHMEKVPDPFSFVADVTGLGPAEGRVEFHV